VHIVVEHFVLSYVLMFWVPCCDVRYDFYIKTMFCSSLPQVVCGRPHVLFKFACVLTIWIAWRMSYKKQELLTLREHMGFLVRSVLLLLLVFCVVFLVRSVLFIFLVFCVGFLVRSVLLIFLVFCVVFFVCLFVCIRPVLCFLFVCLYSSCVFVKRLVLQCIKGNFKSHRVRTKNVSAQHRFSVGFVLLDL
jgi:hypothetical protein